MRFNVGLFLVGAASHAYAQAQTTLSVFDLFLNEGGHYSGAVISANPSTTALRVGCAGPTASDCSGSPPIYITKVNANTWQGSAYPDPAFTYTFSCVVTSTPSLNAVCYTSAGGSEANFPGAATETYPGDTTSTFTFAPVVITEGAQKLLAASATATSSSSGSRRMLFSDLPLNSSSSTQTISATRSSITTTGNAQSTSSAAAAAAYVRGGKIVAAAFAGGLAIL